MVACTEQKEGTSCLLYHCGSTLSVAAFTCISADIEKVGFYRSASLPGYVNHAWRDLEQVYKEAAKMQRLIITFKGKDFKTLATTSKETGIIYVSRNLPDEQIDSKLVSLLMRRTPNSLYGKFTPLTGETQVVA